MLKRGALIGVIVAILGAGAIPAVSSSARGKKHHARCSAKASKRTRARTSKRSAKCRKPRRHSARKGVPSTHLPTTPRTGSPTTGAGTTDTGTTGTGTAGTGTTGTGTTGTGTTGTGTAGTGTTGTGTTGTGTGFPSAADGGTALQIVYTNREGFSDLTYTLTCDPASGTIAEPAAVCAQIASQPEMVFAEPYGDHSCPPSSALSVSGEYGGRAVKVTFSPCAFGPDYQGSWERFLPTEAEQNEIGIDRAVGPFALGETQSSVEALLARPPAGTPNGLYVYHPWNFVTSSCARSSSGAHPILAIRYNSEGRVETVIGNQNTLAIQGQKVWSLLVRCPHPETLENVPRSEGPLKSWLPAMCGGREALADHPLSEGAAPQDITIVIPAGVSDQFSVVIATSDPASACEDAARLNAEWGA